MNPKFLISGLTALALAATPAFATEPFRERLTVPLSDPSRPAHLEVSLVLGGITVVGGGAAREVLIEAVARPAGGDEPEAVEPSRRGLRRIPNDSLGLEAEEKDNHVSISAESWRQALDLRVTVPTGSSLVLSSVNDGEIVVAGVEGELELHNTNGSIRVENARGPVSAATVNGDVTVAFAASGVAAAPMAFSTLNGDIELKLPTGFKADVRLRSDNGEIYSDFDVALESAPAIEEVRKHGRYHLILEREMTGKIGGGGPDLLLKTFNGDIVLRRAGGG